MGWIWSLVGVAVALCSVACAAAPKPPSPAAACNPHTTARLVADQIQENRLVFYDWSYGGAIVFDGIFQTMAAFPDTQDLETILDSYLTNWAQNSSGIAFKVLHNETLPWDSAIGDHIGLFPINYLNRALYRAKHPKAGYDNSSDLAVARAVAARYIMQWPVRLADGTVSRNVGWPGEQGHGSFVWGDDQFMGTALVARLAVLDNNAAYAKAMADQQRLFAQHLRDASDGVYFHAENAADSHHSCCKWGRANGWAMLGRLETLACLAHFPELKEDFEAVRLLLEDQATALAKAQQADDGRWHQLVNDSSTFLETSSTAMYLTAMLRGMREGWLDKTTFGPVAQRAWGGLCKTIQPDGKVSGICEGTGVQVSAADYAKRSTAYLLSGPGGLGTVLYAAVEMAATGLWQD